MKLHFWQFSQFKYWFLAIFEIAKNGIWSKKIFEKLIILISRVFWPGLSLYYLAHYVVLWSQFRKKNFFFVQTLISLHNAHIIFCISIFSPHCDNESTLFFQTDFTIVVVAALEQPCQFHFLAQATHFAIDSFWVRFLNCARGHHTTHYVVNTSIIYHYLLRARPSIRNWSSSSENFILGI